MSNKEQHKNINAITISAVIIAIIAVIIAVMASLGYRSALDELAEPMVVKASQAERNDMLNRLGTALENLKQRNLLVSIQEGQDAYTMMLTNDQGEYLTQSQSTGYVTVYRNDNKAIRYQEYIDYGADSNAISIMDAVYGMASDGEVEVYGVPDEDKADGYTQVVIDIRGWDQIASMYNRIDPSLGEIMVGQLQASLSQSSDSETDSSQVDEQSSEEQTEAQTESSNTEVQEIDTLNFRFLFIVYNETTQFDSAACYMYFDDADSEDVGWNSDSLATSWAITGLVPIEKWSLDTDWYTLDFENYLNWTDEQGEEANELLRVTLADLVDMTNRVLESYSNSTIDDNTSDTETEANNESESTESSEDTSNTTEDTGEITDNSSSDEVSDNTSSVTE
jgi:hypothetical protein